MQEILNKLFFLTLILATALSSRAQAQKSRSATVTIKIASYVNLDVLTPSLDINVTIPPVKSPPATGQGTLEFSISSNAGGSYGIAITPGRGFPSSWSLAVAPASGSYVKGQTGTQSATVTVGNVTSFSSQGTYSATATITVSNSS
jgi:hypothetical protein